MLTLENPFELESLAQPARSTTAILAIAAPPTKYRMSFLLASRALGVLVSFRVPRHAVRATSSRLADTLS
jgi:hypothetical protein